ncbi:uncharacterized protein LOC734581 [Xenopus laevis]|uniref:Uncharacterized protein LOC734581 n=2 Tax=Xenopus laevis TaxID=8355 RepID=A0A8J0Q445_XENLA|nr:uncharacterized protein LOC734581 [Xenopus laevis]
MASVRLPRMCCYVDDTGTSLVLGFKPTLCHSASVCSAVVGLGVMGFCYYRSYAKKEQQFVRMARTLNLATFLGTSGLLLRSLIWLCAPEFLFSQKTWFPRAVCVLISTWIHYFYSVLFWAFFCFSLEVAQLFSPNPERFRKLYAFVCWGAPSLLWLHGFLILGLPNTPEDSCDSKQSLVLFHDVLVYIPFMFALLGSPLLLRHTITKVPVVLRMRCGIYTSSERFREHSLRRRFIQICSAFITCWICNIVCDFLLLLVELHGGTQAPQQMKVAALTLWVIMGIMNPMYCCLHSLAFLDWRSGGTLGHISTCDSSSKEDYSGSLQEKRHLLNTEQAQAIAKMTLPNISKLMDLWASASE